MISSNFGGIPHSLPTGTAGPSRLPVSAPSPAPISTETAHPQEAFQKTLADSLIQPGCSAEQKATIEEALASFRNEDLEALRRQGLSIGYSTTGFAKENDGGLYKPKSIKAWQLKPEIMMNANIGQEHDLVGMVRHEITHALDAMRQGSKFDELTYAGQFKSNTDPELRSLFRDYQAHHAVDLSGKVINDIKKNPQLDLSGPIQGKLTDSFGQLQFTYAPGSMFPDKKPRIMLETDEKKLDFKSVKRSSLLAAASGAVALVMGGPLTIAAGAAFLLLGGLGMHAAHSLQSEADRNRPNTHFEQSVQLPDGREVKVRKDGGKTILELPEDWLDHQTTTGRSWNDYAGRSGKVEEYLAEGARHFLGTAEQRSLLQNQDKGLFDYLQGQNLAR